MARLDSVMILATYGGLALFPILAAVYFLRGRKRLGSALLLSLAGSLALTLILQFLAMRPRPDASGALIPVPGFPSFPSGHAALAFSAATLLGFSHRQVRWWLGAGLAAAAIAISRVYLGVHFASDVLAGAVLGAGTGAGVYGLVFWGGLKPAGLRWLIWPQAALLIVISTMAYLDILPQKYIEWPYADKILHSILVGTPAFFLELWLPGRAIRILRAQIPLASLVLIGLGTADEILQLASAVRSADIFDLGADIIGIIIFQQLAVRWTGRVALPGGEAKPGQRGTGTPLF